MSPFFPIYASLMGLLCVFWAYFGPPPDAF